MNDPLSRNTFLRLAGGAAVLLLTKTFARSAENEVTRDMILRRSGRRALRRGVRCWSDPRSTGGVPDHAQPADGDHRRGRASPEDLPGQRLDARRHPHRPSGRARTGEVGALATTVAAMTARERRLIRGLRTPGSQYSAT